MGSLWIFALTIFLSATLLFSVQPMFGKMALPLLGGNPSVWNTCMFFFQAVLLAGYGYAHLTTRFLGTRRQAALHLVVISLPFFLLPIAVPEGWVPPEGTNPVFWLLGLLTVGVGAPFFAISATNPLLQQWFSRTSHRSANDPYFLYGSSNLGSMLALLSYPILVEPLLRLQQQSFVWASGYGALTLLIAVCAVMLWRSPKEQPASLDVKLDRDSTSEAASSEVTNARRWRWIALSFVPSSWMLGVTTTLTTDIAPIPLLWILPLALYLLTFVLAFARRSIAPHVLWVKLFAYVMIGLVASLMFISAWQLMPLHLAAFFVGSMVCHNKLASDRPAATHLTEFYFWMSLGGVFGGMFNALIAPAVFPCVLEYPLTMGAACLLCSTFVDDRVVSVKSFFNSRRFDIVLLIVFVGVVYVAMDLTKKNVLLISSSVVIVWVAVCATPLLFIFYYLNKTRWFGFVLCAAMLLSPFEISPGEKWLFMGRDFFGVHRVTEDSEHLRWLWHGTTVHGLQSRDANKPSLNCEPLTYYHRNGPLGDIFQICPAGESESRVAIVGLGAGAALCYRAPHRKFTVYEIDPVVVRLAEDPEYFTYLDRCVSGDYEIILGDGRLKLAEAPASEYDLIVFDAFSSDAIPMHMLTREAIAAYLEKLKQGGIIAFHISNKHLDLSHVLADLAADAGLVCCRGTIISVPDEEWKATRLTVSTWCVLARDESDVKRLLTRARWKDISPDEPGRPWTDDFSNLIRILRW